MHEESNMNTNPILSSMSFHFALANVANADRSELAAAVATLQTLTVLLADTLKQRGVLHPLTELAWQLTPSRLTPKVKEIHLSASFLHLTTGSLKSTWRDILTGPEKKASSIPLEKQYPLVGLLNQGTHA